MIKIFINNLLNLFDVKTVRMRQIYIKSRFSLPKTYYIIQRLTWHGWKTISFPVYLFDKTAWNHEDFDLLTPDKQYLGENFGKEEFKVQIFDRYHKKHTAYYNYQSKLDYVDACKIMEYYLGSHEICGNSVEVGIGLYRLYTNSIGYYTQICFKINGEIYEFYANESKNILQIYDEIYGSITSSTKKK